MAGYKEYVPEKEMKITFNGITFKFQKYKDEENYYVCSNCSAFILPGKWLWYAPDGGGGAVLCYGKKCLKTFQDKLKETADASKTMNMDDLAKELAGNDPDCDDPDCDGDENDSNTQQTP